VRVLRHGELKNIGTNFLARWQQANLKTKKISHIYKKKTDLGLKLKYYL